MKDRFAMGRMPISTAFSYGPRSKCADLTEQFLFQNSHTVHQLNFFGIPVKSPKKISTALTFCIIMGLSYRRSTGGQKKKEIIMSFNFEKRLPTPTDIREQ